MVPEYAREQPPEERGQYEFAEAEDRAKLMSLESTQSGGAAARMHLMDGDTDALMPVRGSIEAVAQLRAPGAIATLDRFPGLVDGIDSRVVDTIVRRLKEPMPAAIGAALRRHPC